MVLWFQILEIISLMYGMSSSGQWSSVYKQVVRVDGQDESFIPSKVVQAGEYFWGDDPGEGEGIAILASDGSFDSQLEEFFSDGIMVPDIGDHIFNVRMMSSSGQWSSVYKQVVRVDGQDESFIPSKVVQAGEYFWGDDPGEGEGIAILASDGSFDSQLEEFFSDGIMVPDIGDHIFNVRMMSSSGQWSSVYKQVVRVDGQDESFIPSKVVQAGEYFWGDDRGGRRYRNPS